MTGEGEGIAQIPNQSKVETSVMTAKERRSERGRERASGQTSWRRRKRSGGPGALCIMVGYVEHRLRQIFTLSLSPERTFVGFGTSAVRGHRNAFSLLHGKPRICMDISI